MVHKRELNLTNSFRLKNQVLDSFNFDSMHKNLKCEHSDERFSYGTVCFYK